MKYRSSILFLIFACFFSACSSVRSKKPVGEIVAELDPKIWNAKWADGEGPVFESRIKTPELGMVEFTTLKAKEPDDLRSFEVIVRKVAGKTIASAKLGKEEIYDFGRIAINEDHLIIFPPKPAKFSSLINSHLLQGTLTQDEKGIKTGSSIIDELTDHHIQLLEDRKERHFEDVSRFSDLFSDDPIYAYVRVKENAKK